MTTDLKTIADSFGRLLTVWAYADMIDQQDCPDWAPGASHGKDWMNVTPEGVPREIADATLEAINLIQGWNRVLLTTEFKINAGLDGHRQPPTLDDFGSDLAHECMGSGVGWGDDHPEHTLDLPHITVSLYLEPHKKSKLLPQGTLLEEFFWKRGWKLGCEISGPYYSQMRDAPKVFETRPVDRKVTA